MSEVEGVPDYVSKFAKDFDGMPGVMASQRRIAKNGYRIFTAFNSLDVFDRESAERYLRKQLDAVKVPADQRERLMAVLLNFAMVCVEADRENCVESKEGST